MSSQETLKERLLLLPPLPITWQWLKQLPQATSYDYESKGWVFGRSVGRSTRILEREKGENPRHIGFPRCMIGYGYLKEGLGRMADQRDTRC